MFTNRYMPESSQVHRCNGKIYDRNEDGDLDITNHTQMVSELYHRKIITYSENKIYPYATIDDLRPDLLVKVRKIVNNLRKDHPWLSMNDMELIKSAQLYQTDLESGKSGITLAGILLLGKDETILSVAPAYRTDLILRKRNLDRYDDRDDVRTNLIESYERIMAFVAKHLPDPFYLEGDQRISIRDVIFREVASNILTHRDFINPFPAKLIIENDLVRTENSNKPHGHGPINPENFSPFPKNPVIARFFREINRADELGSGVRNLMKYGKAYGGKSPELIEEDIFRIVVWIPSDNQDKDRKVDDHTLTRLESRLESGIASKIMLLLQNKPMGKAEIAKMLGHKIISGELNKQIKRLLSFEFIEMTLPEKPTSRLQQYFLSLKGSELIKSLE